MVGCGECTFEGLSIRSELDGGVATLHIDSTGDDPVYTRVVLMKLRSLIDAALERNVTDHPGLGVSLDLDPEAIRNSLRRVVQ
jgi:hypothetical protein